MEWEKQLKRCSCHSQQIPTCDLRSCFYSLRLRLPLQSLLERPQFTVLFRRRFEFGLNLHEFVVSAIILRSTSPQASNRFKHTQRQREKIFLSGNRPRRKLSDWPWNTFWVELLFVCAPPWKTTKRLHGHSSLFTSSKGVRSKANFLSAIQTIDYRGCWLMNFTNVSVFCPIQLHFEIVFTLIHNSNLFKERTSLISFGWTLETLLFALCPTSFGFNWTKLNARRVERKIQLFSLPRIRFYCVLFLDMRGLFVFITFSWLCECFSKAEISRHADKMHSGWLRNSATMLFFIQDRIPQKIASIAERIGASPLTSH